LKSPLYCRWFVTWPSLRPPSELTANVTAFCRSWNVSNMNAMLSLPIDTAELSRRMSLAMRRSGWDSQHLTDT